MHEEIDRFSSFNLFLFWRSRRRHRRRCWSSLIRIEGVTNKMRHWSLSNIHFCNAGESGQKLLMYWEYMAGKQFEWDIYEDWYSGKGFNVLSA